MALGVMNSQQLMGSESLGFMIIDRASNIFRLFTRSRRRILFNNSWSIRIGNV